jgi:hypothetical protein
VARWSRRALLQGVLVGLLGAVGTARTPARHARAQEIPPVDRFVGTVAESNAFIGLALSPARDAVAAYVCDVDPAAAAADTAVGAVWFRGANPGQALRGGLLRNGAWSLIVDLLPPSPSGALFYPDGSVHGFQSSPTSQGGYFYELARSEAPLVGGWIFLGTGELRGELISRADPTIRATPVFEAGPTQLQVPVAELRTTVMAELSGTAAVTDPPMEPVNLAS